MPQIGSHPELSIRGHSRNEAWKLRCSATATGPTRFIPTPAYHSTLQLKQHHQSELLAELYTMPSKLPVHWLPLITWPQPLRGCYVYMYVPNICRYLPGTQGRYCYGFGLSMLMALSIHRVNKIDIGIELCNRTELAGVCCLAVHSYCEAKPHTGKPHFPIAAIIITFTCTIEPLGSFRQLCTTVLVRCRYNYSTRTLRKASDSACRWRSPRSPQAAISPARPNHVCSSLPQFRGQQQMSCFLCFFFSGGPPKSLPTC